MIRSLRRGRKGYFFLLDAFLAMSVLVLGMLIVYSFRSYSPSQVQPILLAADVMESLSSNKVDDLAAIETEDLTSIGVYVQRLITNGNITTLENTLLEQIGEFYALNNTELARDFTRNITNVLVPSQYGFMLYIHDDPTDPDYSIYSVDFNVTVNDGLVPPNESSMLVTSKRIVSGIINGTVMWGPFIMEARVWL